MNVFAIDPGPTLSAYVEWDGSKIVRRGKVPNREVRQILYGFSIIDDFEIVCEKIASYGMTVGAEVFQTCFWTGRFWEICERLGNEFHLTPRLVVKLHLCHSARANDSNIRQALIDRLGPPGKKASPGLTYGVSGDEWAALALAVTHFDTRK